MNYLTPKDYFAGYADHPGILDGHRAQAAGLLVLVNKLLAAGLAYGVVLKNNPKTGSLVSGERDGGWRPQECPTGAPNSAHKTGQAVDVYDPDGDLDDWLTDHVLQMHGLYREHPSATRGWCHLTTRPVKSGKRTFYP